MFRYVIIAGMCALTVYNRNRAPKTLVHEVAGSSPQRVAAVSAVITRHQVPPTPILDAHFVEEQSGDGTSGPSYFRAFYLVEVAPQDLPQWTRLLTPLAALAEYDAPREPCAWWMTRNAFASLQFYKSDTLTGIVHGWIGLSPETGRIYIFTSRM